MARQEKSIQNTIIQLSNVSKFYDGKPALVNLSLSIKRGEFVTLLGPSGCGKTTTLRLLAGFELPQSGTIFYNGEDITKTPPYRRRINTVFQKYALFPHLNVFNNIAFGLKLKYIPDGEEYQVNGETFCDMRKLTKEEINQKVNDALKMVNLEDYGHRDVNSLSGGQQQRVAIARAIVNEPEMLLLDEPLGALDLKMRKDMQLELMNMQKKLGITFVYVTHDQEEALTMSDRIVVMREGVVQQIGSPKKIYDEPANAFVANFIGESNIFSGVMIKDFTVSFINHQFECVDKGFKCNEPVDIIVRPEDMRIVAADAANCMFRAEVISSVFKGTYYQITALTIDENERNEVLIHDDVECDIGEVIGVNIKPSNLHIMRKSRIINALDTEMWDEGFVEICGGKFECKSTLEAGTPVRASIDFDDVILYDDEDDGIIGAEIVSSIYKGSYYQVIARTDDYYEFFIDTEDDWLIGDRVGIGFEPEKIIIEKLEPEGAQNER